MCCNTFLILLAMVIGTLAMLYLFYQTYSYIKCGCGKYGPFVASYGKIKEDMIQQARQVLKSAKSQMIVTDLGCGNGTLLLPLAKEFPEHTFIGYEWDLVPLFWGRIRAKGLKNISFVQADYMKISYKEIDLIMCYVLKVTGEPLGKILAEQIKDDAIVISEMFPLYHLEEIKQVQSSIYGVPEKIFVYKKAKTKKPIAKKDAVKKATVKKATTKKAPAKKTPAKK